MNYPETVALITAELLDAARDGKSVAELMSFGTTLISRDGMAQSPLALDADSLDLVITNALILDAAQGVIKADIGITTLIGGGTGPAHGTYATTW